MNNKRENLVYLYGVTMEQAIALNIDFIQYTK